MSIPIDKIVRCPKCGTDIKFTMWQSINNEIPSAMKDMISGALFEVECENCGLRNHVNYPILVNDMEHNMMIYYTYPDDLEETEKALESMKEWYGGHLRIVTDQASLREKVAIFNAGLDDRVVELMKALVITQLHEQIADKTIQGAYYCVGENSRIEIVCDDGSGYIPVSKELYDRVRKEFFSKGPLANDQEFYIDRKWASSLLATGDTM